MPRASDSTTLQSELTALLQSAFPGLRIEIAQNTKWNRTSVTFFWKGFTGLLPEERFHRLVQKIPEAMRKTRMAGFVWLELAPGEKVEEFLKLPRSEDVAGREKDVYQRLSTLGFFKALADELGAAPEKICDGGFSISSAILERADSDTLFARDAKLLFIRHGVYCDCQVSQSVEPAMIKAFGSAKQAPRR